MISYNYRDLFYDPDAHKDILIVPQKTQVIPKAGRTPLIKVYNPNTQTYVEQGTPVGDHKLTLNFIITNRNIYKEKFELTESINSADDLAFGSCEPQQVRFTIRNEKYKDENGEICDVVPPLTGAELIDGSVEMSSYQEIIKVYLYFNGDSSTLFYVGMYIVEEDKASKDGKTRDITAYDYLYQLRDMDISNWYKHLFGKGITTKTTDATESGYYYDGDFYEDSEHTPELKIIPDDDTVYTDLSTDKEYYCDVIDAEHYTYYELSEDTKLEGEVVIRPGRPDKSEGGKEYWTIYELLYDLFQNLIVLKNDDSYYTGYGAQLWFDESIFNDNSKWYNLNKFKIKQNKNFIDNGSLSLGKLLEDIGIILGAYPKIMRGVPNSNGWCDALGESKDIVTPIPNASSAGVVNYTTHLTDYCVLTFIRLDKSTNKINKAQIVKEYKMLSGMSAEIYDVASVNLMRLYNSDGKVITSYSGGIVNNDLIKAYNTGKYKKIRAAYESGTNPDGTKKEGFVSITTYDVVDNIFFNQYGVKFKKKNSDGSTDTEEISIKDNEPKLQSVLKRMFNAVNSRIYKPYEMQCIADLCRETGDRIRIINKFDEFNPLDFKTYILERKLSGIQKMIDTYSAKGSNGLPNFGNYKSGSSYAQSGMGGNKVSMSGGSGGFSAESSDSEGNVEDNTIDMTTYCELARNWGMRFLDEPNVTTCTYNKKKKKVVMKWEDPDDLDDNKPIPCTWVGTVVVRKENSAPLNPYDGDIIVNSTTRDEYKSTAFQDRTAKKGKEYYYAFMPYYLYIDDTSNPIYVYRPTKSIKIDTGELSTSPVIESATPAGSTVSVTYTLPSGCESAKIVAKKGEEPEDEEDGIVEDISVEATTGTITVANLDIDSEYFFKIFVDASESNVANASTSMLSWTFPYTGYIEEFTAPKTGYYQLEVWGAQGGNAIDGNTTARGGYGSYSKGEVFLNEGDKLYIDVGGQNGYNGGGNAGQPGPDIPSNIQSYLNIINGRRENDTFYCLRDFFWYDYVGDPNDHGFYWFDGTASEHSFFLRNGGNSRPEPYQFGDSSYVHSRMISVIQPGNTVEEAYCNICAAPITSIYITGSNDSYSFTTDLNGKIQALWVNDRFGGGYHHYSGNLNREISSGTYSFGCNTSDGSSSYDDFTCTDTLENVFKVLSMYCRNVNIYVNGECWTSVPT